MNAAARTLIDLWAHWATSSLWQVTWLVVALLALELLLRRRGWPQLRMALWMLVAVRLVLPPGVGSPLDLASGLAAVTTAGAPTAAGGVPTDAAAAATGIAWAALLCGTWALGAALLLCAGWVRRRRARGHVLCTDFAESVPRWLDVLAADCSRRLGLRTRPRLVCTPRVAGAAVVGALRPVVAVSTEFVRSASREDVEHVLLHELAHVLRRDPLQRVMLEMLRALYWFHPAVWLAVRRIEDLREVCCDATVASVLRADTAAYRRTLLRTGRVLLEGPASHGTLGWFRRPSQLLTRLAWLEAPTWERPARRRALTTAALAVLLAVAMPRAPRTAAIAAAAPTDSRPSVAVVPSPDIEQRSDPSAPVPTPAGIAAAKQLLSRVDDVHGRPGTHQLRAAAAYLVWAGEYDPTSRDD